MFSPPVLLPRRDQDQPKPLLVHSDDDCQGFPFDIPANHGVVPALMFRLPLRWAKDMAMFKNVFDILLSRTVTFSHTGVK